jgi:hypothetical protein
MYIPLTCLFLAGSALLATSPTSVAQNNYSEGLALSRQSGRPLVVFVATSTTGERASMEGKLTPEARKILAEQYVYVVLDAKADRALIDAFGIHQENGFVISDRSLQLQAYIHHGAFDSDQLVRLLQQYSAPNLVVATTQSNVVRYSSYPSAPSAPAFASGPTFAAAPVFAQPHYAHAACAS